MLIAIIQTSIFGIERIKISVQDDCLVLLPPLFIEPLLSIFVDFWPIRDQSCIDQSETDLDIPLITLITRSQFIAAIKRNDPIMQIFHGFSIS